MQNTKVWSDSIERPRRLQELGLDESILFEAVLRGQRTAANCTINHPPFYRGITPWAETTCGVRESLIPRGWRRFDDGNLPFTINETGTVAITVATGDQDTGLDHRDSNPGTKSRKGPHTARAVKGNSMAQTLFGDIRPTPSDLQKFNARTTWILLFHRDEKTSEIRAELSLPAKMTKDGQVEGWLERIILGSIPFGGGTLAKVPVEPPQTPDIDINIKRRA